MSAMQRTKGARGEREFCKELSAYLGDTVLRKLDAAREGGEDVQIGAWCIEIKRGEKPNLSVWWQQAVANAAAKGSYPALAWRQNRQPWTVRVPQDVLMYGKGVWAPTLDLMWTAVLSLPGFATVVREIGMIRDPA